MLHAFNYTHPATTAVEEAARNRLLERTRQKIEINAEFLDLARIADPRYELRTAEFLREKYARIPLDVIMTIGGLALPFVVKHHNSVAGKIPIVFAANSPAQYSALRQLPGITGVMTEIELGLDETLTLAERLQPDARSLVVIAGSSPRDREWQAIARRAVERRRRKFETTYLFDLTYDGLVTELARVSRDAIVIVLTVTADSSGKAFVPAEVAATVASVSPAPVYSLYDTHLGNGIVGGFIETYESVGKAAADMILEILDGKDASTIPPKTNPGQTYRVDFNAMTRWGLRESNLPPNTIVMFKSLSIWEQYRWQFNSILGVLFFQAALITWLLFERHRRRAAELGLRDRLLEVIHLNRSAAAGALSASVAHELNQPLGAILSYAEAAELYLKADPPNIWRVEQILSNIRRDDQRAAEIISHLRGLLKKQDAIEWQEFDHPIYPQLYGDFVPMLSAIDMLFNCGVAQSREILRSR